MKIQHHLMITMLLPLMLIPIIGRTKSTVPGLEGHRIFAFSDSSSTLKDRLAAAYQEALRSDGEEYFLTAHVITTSITACDGDHFTDHENPDVATIHRRGDRLLIHRIDRCQLKESTVTKETHERTVLLLHKRTDTSSTAVDVAWIHPDRTYHIDGPPLIWLGAATTSESLADLATRFPKAPVRLRKHILGAMAVHDTAEAEDFLFRTTCHESFSLEVRKSAVFWLGMRKTVSAVSLLKDILKQAREGELQKAVVFALYCNGGRQAVDELIRIARYDPAVTLRKQALFWIGQKASRECITALQDVVLSDDDLSVRSSAVFAISRLPKDRSVPMLIDIARNHGSSRLRKKAIFWLSQSGDDRALAFFESILLQEE